MLAGDFAFRFAQGDSAGNAFHDHPIGREDLLDCLARLFAGGGSLAPADSVLLAFDPVLQSFPDSRQGKDPTWHREIVTGVDLAIWTGGAEYRITGNARFFVARGDSAVIPADLAAEGVRPDSTRWYIDGWHDETLREEGTFPRVVPAMPQPSNDTTWGGVLARYYGSSGALRH